VVSLASALSGIVIPAIADGADEDEDEGVEVVMDRVSTAT
jgi:hypothetical protein